MGSRYLQKVKAISSAVLLSSVAFSVVANSNVRIQSGGRQRRLTSRESVWNAPSQEPPLLDPGPYSYIDHITKLSFFSRETGNPGFYARSAIFKSVLISLKDQTNSPVVKFFAATIVNLSVVSGEP